MTILKAKFRGIEVPMYAAKISVEEKSMSAKEFDKKIKRDFREAMELKRCKHVCSYMHEGCVFAWETLDESEEKISKDRAFALSLNLPVLRSIVADSEPMEVAG